MAKQISLKKNFVMNIFLTLSTFIFPLITFPYVSRVLGPEAYGRVTFATSVITYFSLFANLGIPTYGIRACAQVRDNHEELTRTAQELLIINLIMTAISYAAMFIIVMVIPRLRVEKKLIFVISASILLTTIGMEWLYKALEQYTYITVRSLIFKVISVIAMFLLVHSEKDYVIYGGISIFASSASNVLNLLNAHRYIGFRPVGNYNLRRHMKAVGIFFAMACATTIYTQLDTVMLGFMSTNKDVGYYNAAVRIKTILVSIVTSLGTVLLPRLSYYIEKKDMEEFKRLTSKALNFVFIIAVPLTVYFILYAKQGVFLLSGDKFAASIMPMRIIMPTVLLIGLSNITGIQILVPLGKEKIVLYSEIAGSVTDIIINWLMIPHFKSTGAAFGTLIAEAVVLLFQYLSLRDRVNGVFKKIPYGKIILATVAASLASIWVMALHMGNFITLLITALLFFGIYSGILIGLKDPIALEIKNTLLSKIKHSND